MVSEIARSHGLTLQQGFTWRQAARRRLSMDGDRVEASFVPAVVDAPSTPARIAVEGREDETPPRAAVGPHDIELDVDGDSVWIWRGADAGLVTTIIRALKATK